MKEVLKKSQGNYRKRLAEICELCKKKAVCEGGDELLDNQEVCILFSRTINDFMLKEQDEGERETKVGGCGRYQPSYRVKELVVYAEWKKHKNDDNQESSIVVTAEKALEILKMIPDEDCEIIGLNLRLLKVKRSTKHFYRNESTICPTGLVNLSGGSSSSA